MEEYLAGGRMQYGDHSKVCCVDDKQMERWVALLKEAKKEE
jgi:hypothetical protein